MNILVLCTGNSARSILLECLLNRIGQGRITTYSAGSKPAGKVHPAALALLRREGYETGNLRSKSWDEFALSTAPEMDVVITVCGNAANEVCPIWPGAPVTAHWGVDDPVVAKDSDRDQAFRLAFETLARRARAALESPIESMDKHELTKAMTQAGAVS